MKNLQAFKDQLEKLVVQFPSNNVEFSTTLKRLADSKGHIERLKRDVVVRLATTKEKSEKQELKAAQLLLESVDKELTFVKQSINSLFKTGANRDIPKDPKETEVVNDFEMDNDEDLLV